PPRSSPPLPDALPISEAEAPERETHRAHEHPPEPDAGRGHEPVQSRGERAGGAPRRPRGEGEEVTGEASGAGSAVGCRRSCHWRSEEHTSELHSRVDL